MLVDFLFPAVALSTFGSDNQHKGNLIETVQLLRGAYQYSGVLVCGVAAIVFFFTLGKLWKTGEVSCSLSLIHLILIYSAENFSIKPLRSPILANVFIRASIVGLCIFLWKLSPKYIVHQFTNWMKSQISMNRVKQSTL